jgi:putative aldouronate transport system substrate-binding protein
MKTKRIIGAFLMIALVFAMVGSLSAQTKLRVELWDRSEPGHVAGKNVIADWIKKEVKAKLNMDVEFVIVPRWQEDKLNVLMAGGQAPDVCILYSEAIVTNYVKSKGLTDLGPLLDQYGKELKAYLGPTVLQYGVWEGKQYAIPAKRTMSAAFAAWVREDWLKKLGMKTPTNMDEFYQMLKAFKEKDPGNVGKDKVIPFALALDPGNIDWTSHMIMASFIKPMNEEDRTALAGPGRWVTPGYKDYMRFMNKLYNEGLISQNFVLDKDGQQYNRDLVQGVVGSLIHNYDYPIRPNPGINTELAKNFPGARFVPFDCFVNSEGKNAKWMYNPNGLFIFVPRYSKNAVGAIKYLNWMVDPANLKIIQNGFKGTHYLDEKNGIPVNFVKQGDLPDYQKYNTNDLAITTNGKEFGSDEANMEAQSQSYPGYEDLFKKALTIAMKDATPTPRLDVIIASEAKYSQTLNQKGSEIFVKSITCKPAEFDATYDSLVKEYMAMGGQAVVDERRAAYKAMVAKRGGK